MPDLNSTPSEQGWQAGLVEQLAEAEARAETLRRQIAAGPCREHGHDWQSDGGCNAGCKLADDGDCGCSVPVNVCTKCGDCDYGENAEAVKVRERCAKAVA